MEARNTIETMDSTGDTKVEWDPTVPEEVEAAQQLFRKLRESQYVAFQVNRDGNQGEQIDRFDPTACRILMVPPMAGG